MKILLAVGGVLVWGMLGQAHAQAGQGLPAYGGEMVAGDAGSEPDAPGASDDAAQPEAAGGDEAEPNESGAASAARQWYFGPYFRYAWIPAFMLDIFLDAAPTINNAAGGIVANYQSTPGGTTFEIGLGYKGFGFEDPFRAKGDPIEDTEWLSSSLGMVHATGSILWGVDIVKGLSFQYGFGLDLGVMTGKLRRSEAYKNASNGWARCSAAGPQFTVQNGIAVPILGSDFYCEQPTTLGAKSDAYDAKEGAQYNAVEERVPPVGLVPMIPHLALRYEPIDNLAFKFEAGYGIIDLWLGLSASYAPKL
jgi:hypothetical protein